MNKIEKYFQLKSLIIFLYYQVKYNTQRIDRKLKIKNKYNF